MFANVSVLQKDIEDAIREDTRAVILDAGGIGSIVLRRRLSGAALWLPERKKVSGFI